MISLALMLVMCVATTLLSFSLADDTPGDGGTGDSGSSFNTTKTNIDYIIENSASAEKDETGRDLSLFYIVEVGSASNGNNSPLKAMVEEDSFTQVGSDDVVNGDWVQKLKEKDEAGNKLYYPGNFLNTGSTSAEDLSHFVKQVINGWSTQNKTMTPNKISYHYIPVGSLTSTEKIDAAISAVSKADLIYVSNDPDSSYSSSKDIPEDLKLILSGAATSTYTPFIIDSPTKTANGGGGGTSATTFTNLAQQVFAKAGYYKNTFSYDVTGSSDITAYMDRMDKKSKWLPISGDSKQVNWFTDDEGKTTARILTIQSSDTDNQITTKFKDSMGLVAYDMTKLTTKYPSFDPTGKEAFDITGTDFKYYGYRSNQKSPDNVVLEKMAPADITADTDLGVYDLVIIESGVKNAAISSDVKNMLSSMVYGMQHIVYDKTMTSSEGGEDQDDIVKSSAVNYQYVVNKVADTNEVSRFTNVLVTGMAEMKIYGAATAPSGVKPIADIINNGSYRGSGGGGSSSNLYTVLEVQPCYPIDLNLAKALKQKGINSLAGKDHKERRNDYDRTDIFYYIHYDSVLNNVTSDEISFDGGITSLSDMESTDDQATGKSARGDVQRADLITTDNAVDYYAWELSRAKVAYLTGLDYNKVNVVHMSTVEFNTSRETLMDNYDAIYIGGNWSALKDVNYIVSQMEGRGRYGRANNPTAYSMYYHNGATYNNGEGVGVLTGNDITWDKYTELQKYIAAGMPVVFTKPVTEAYYAAKQNGYNNRLMDPDSNVCKLMDLCMNGTATETKADSGQLWYPTKQANVLAGFDPTDQIKVLNDGSYGTTYSGYATVFGGMPEPNAYYKDAVGDTVPNPITTPDTTAVNGEEFSQLLKESSERPKFSLLQAPATYVEGDESTFITGNSISFKFDVASKADYIVTVYVDDNTNSRFEDTEVVYGPKKNPGGKITANFPSSFDGALYWKFEIQSGNCKSSVTGLSKVKVKVKNYVNVLQIAPAAAANSSINSDVSLLFCTECQQARGILKGNRYTNVGKYSSASAYNGPVFSDDNYGDIPGTPANPATYDSGFTNGAAGKNLGIHRHNFGIVKYDSNYTLGGYTGLDNWETNWAEDVYNDYDIDMDIWTTREFEANVADAMTKVTKANADQVLENYKSLASIYKNYYLTMQQVIDGTVDTASANYTYLKNKLTRNEANFVEADVNSLFGEDMSVYALETAKGGFHVSDADFAQFITAQTTLDNLLKSGKGKMSTDKTTLAQMDQEIDYETTYHRYSDFFSLFNASSQIKGVGTDFYDKFKTAFSYWRNAKIFEQYFYKMYMKYLTYSTMKEYNDVYIPDYTEIYSCIVVGVGENFGGDDIKTAAAIDALKFYIENEGNTFIFHQTINDSGSTKNLTANLKTLFGQNYNHVTTKTIKETGIRYRVEVRYENGSTSTVNEGTIKEGEGLTVQAGYTKTDNGHYSSATATKNTAGNVVLNWETKDTNGNPSGAYYYAESVSVYINDTAVVNGFKPPADGSTKNGSSTYDLGNPTPQTVTRVVNESPSDTNRYHYTPLKTDGSSIAVSPTHKTFYNTGVFGNDEKEGLFNWTQTGVLKSDNEVPTRHINFISDASQYGWYTDRATRTNEGVVTMYPFLIASELKISGTHPNSFSTDIEDKNLVVYYALAGGADGSHSSISAADPQDGIDDYFIYSYGSVTYCGAGHTLLTGRKRDNNDERRLFINIILNSSKKSIFGPTIDVYDPYPEKKADGTIKTDEEGNPVYTNNDITKAEDGSYETVVPSMDSVPEFTYRVTIPDANDEVTHVKIYYDLSRNASAGEYGFVNGTDVSIFEADARDDDSILKNKYKLISKAIKELALKPEYFRPYDNKYTYIVIAVKTRKGTVTLQRIMVKIAPKLWDMT